MEQLRFSSGELAEVVARMRACSGDTLHERLQRLRIGIWRMETLAERYLPVLGNDLAVNDQDAELEGRTDCVDNATNTIPRPSSPSCGISTPCPAGGWASRGSATA